MFDVRHEPGEPSPRWQRLACNKLYFTFQVLKTIEYCKVAEGIWNKGKDNRFREKAESDILCGAKMKGTVEDECPSIFGLQLAVSWIPRVENALRLFWINL